MNKPPPPLPPRPSSSDENTATLKATQHEEKQVKAPPIPPRVPTVHKRERVSKLIVFQITFQSKFQKISLNFDLLITEKTKLKFSNLQKYKVIFDSVKIASLYN